MIRFRKIKKLIKSIYGFDTEIHLTTSLKDVLAYAELKNNTVEILINSNKVKSEIQVLVVVAHEISEIYLKTKLPKKYKYQNIHRNRDIDNKHRKKLLDLLKKFSKEFDYQLDDIVYVMGELDEMATSCDKV